MSTILLILLVDAANFSLN